MTEEQMKATIRGFLQSSVAGDITKALSFLTDDAVWVAPQGTFKGIAEIKHLLTWNNQIAKDSKVAETGIGIITQGHIGVIEHKLSGTTNGMKWEIPATCIYEFKNNKIQNLKGFFDTLALAKQAAKGPFAKMVVKLVVNRTEKGLH